MADTSILERFMAKVEMVTESGCWIWMSRISPWGYGVFTLNGRSQYAHRVAYDLLRGSIPKHLEIDHLCRVKSCVNPFHLEPVSHQENSRRRWAAEILPKLKRGWK